jgi:hypothetical protein
MAQNKLYNKFFNAITSFKFVTNKIKIESDLGNLLQKKTFNNKFKLQVI